MAIQQWTVVVLAGEAGRDAVRRCEGWWEARRAREEGVVQARDWSAGVRRAGGRYLETLRAHRFEVPVVYFCEHVDGWLMGEDVRRCLPGVKGGVMHGGGELWWYKLPDGGRMLRRNRALVKSAQFLEGRWLATRLVEAADVVRAFWKEGTVLVNREVAGVSKGDGEAVEMAKRLPAWLR